LNNRKHYNHFAAVVVDPIGRTLIKSCLFVSFKEVSGETQTLRAEK